jgi:hypothetical protein
MYFKRIFSMRNMLTAGIAGLVLAIGAAGAAYAYNPNVPSWSPLSINTNLGQSMYRYHAHRMSEHRAAYATPTPPDRPIFGNGSSEADHMGSPDNGDNSAVGTTNEAPMADR